MEIYFFHYRAISLQFWPENNHVLDSISDVVSAVINSQGVFTGLYDSEEMVSGNVKDKDSKIRYLEKLLDALSWALGGKSGFWMLSVLT